MQKRFHLFYNGKSKLLAFVLALAILASSLVSPIAYAEEDVILWTKYDREAFEEAETLAEAMPIFARFASTLAPAREATTDDEVSALLWMVSNHLISLYAAQHPAQDYGKKYEANGIQYFNQGFYPDVPYSWETDEANNIIYDDQGERTRATVANSGCGITCFAMLLTAYTGVEHSPATLAPIANAYGIDTVQTWDAFRQLADIYHLEYLGTFSGPNYPWNEGDDKFDNSFTMDEIDRYLDEGHMVIASMDPGADSFWARGGHYVLIVGKTPDGKYMVNDPASADRSKMLHDATRITSYCKGRIIIANPNIEAEEGTGGLSSTNTP